MSLGTWLYTRWHGRLVGTDEQGNRYFEERRAPVGRRHRRWVIYDGEREASRVPPMWHAWLHHTTDSTPADTPRPARSWQKPHQPNRTGTTEAYRPSGHDFSGANRARATGDYEPWRPD